MPRLPKPLYMVALDGVRLTCVYQTHIVHKEECDSAAWCHRVPAGLCRAPQSPVTAFSTERLSIFTIRCCSHWVNSYTQIKIPNLVQEADGDILVESCVFDVAQKATPACPHCWERVREDGSLVLFSLPLTGN